LRAVTLIERSNEGRHISRVMLAIRVHLHQCVVALGEGEPEAHPHGSTNAEVERVAHYLGTCPSRHDGRVVFRTIIDDQDVGIRNRFEDRSNHSSDRRDFVQCRDNDKY
jgi:hypothetical protein